LTETKINVIVYPIIILLIILRNTSKGLLILDNEKIIVAAEDSPAADSIAAPSAIGLTEETPELPSGESNNSKGLLRLVFSWVIQLFEGAIIGTGAILPGISGGVMAIIFGIYEPLMEFLSDIRKNFIKNVLFFLPILIGMFGGVVALSGLVKYLFEVSPGQITLFFVGCIAGTLPFLFKTADKHGRRANHTIALVISIVVTLAVLLCIDWFGGGGESVVRLFALFGKEIAHPAETGSLLGQSVEVKPFFGGFTDGFSLGAWLQSCVLWIVCGVIVAAGVIIPGLSPSSLLIYVGLYEKMTDAFSVIDISILIPLGVGMVLCLLLFSKLANYLFKKAHGTMYNIVIGIVIASTIMIIPTVYPSVSYAVTCILCLAVGFALAFGLSILQKKVDYRDAE
jgi:putative membrane protein